MPQVSIAMPVYNCERFIAQSLESLLGQTFADFELVISDNASTDATEALCRRYAALDKRVRYVRRIDNIGGPANFRHVFSLCSGEYHKWSAADDYWHPRFLEEAAAVLDGHPDVVLCYPMTQLVDAAGAKLAEYDDNLHLVSDSPRERFRELYRRIGLCNAPYGLIRRKAMAQTRLIAAHEASDVDFLAELALLGKFWLMPNVRFFRRFHPDCSSWVRDDPRHQQQYYAPGRMDVDRASSWRRFAFQFHSVWRSPIDVTDKAALSVDVARWMRYKRYVLLHELYSSLFRGSIQS